MLVDDPAALLKGVIESLAKRFHVSTQKLSRESELVATISFALGHATMRISVTETADRIEAKGGENVNLALKMCLDGTPLT